MAVVFLAGFFLAVQAGAASAFDLTPDGRIALTETYGALAAKWVTAETATNKIAEAAQDKAATAEAQLLKALTKLAKKPTPAQIEKFKSTVEKLLAKGKGQTSALVWASLFEAVGVTAQVGLSGSVSVGSGSGEVTHSFELTQQYSKTVQGHPVTVYYSALPTSAQGPYAFNALILSDEVTVQNPRLNAIVGIWVSVIVDANLIGALAPSGVANETTAAAGKAVNVPVGLTVNGETAASATSSFDATYFSIQDLFGVAVPPAAVEKTQAAFAKLLEKLAKLSQ